MELVVSVIVLMIIMNFAIPQYRVAMEQNRVDLAGSRLLMIYTAQRMYFVENQTFAPALSDLIGKKLLDPSLAPGAGADSKFFYAIDSADATAFSAKATRSSTPTPQVFSGFIAINQKGELSGTVQSADSSIILTASRYALGL